MHNFSPSGLDKLQKRLHPLKTRKRPNLPVVGLIGPTNIRRISQASGLPEQLYRDNALRAGALIAKHQAIMAMVPDRGIAMSGLRGYASAQGAWTIGLVPDGGPSDSVATPNCVENAAACDEVIDGFTWHHQHAAICELSDLMVCIGLSCGTLTEIAWTKWVRGPRVLALSETFTAIPIEILAETDVVLVDSLDALDAAIGRELSGGYKDKRQLKRVPS
jgi:predicted Rossmann-fold nucleotide-binding protein